MAYTYTTKAGAKLGASSSRHGSPLRPITVPPPGGEEIDLETRMRNAELFGHRFVPQAPAPPGFSELPIQRHKGRGNHHGRPQGQRIGREQRNQRRQAERQATQQEQIRRNANRARVQDRQAERQARRAGPGDSSVRLLPLLFAMMVLGGHVAAAQGQMGDGRQPQEGEGRRAPGRVQGPERLGNSTALVPYRAQNSTALETPSLFGSLGPLASMMGSIGHNRTSGLQTPPTGGNRNATSTALVPYRGPGPVTSSRQQSVSTRPPGRSAVPENRSPLLLPGPRLSPPQTPVGTRSDEAMVHRASQSLQTDFDTVRIGMEDAGGFGHQAAGLSTMEELSGLGFSGTLNLIYNNASGLALRLPTLIPGMNPHQPNQTLPFGNATLVATEENAFQQQRGGQIADSRTLGMVAASNVAQVGTNWAERLGTQEVLNMQPHLWADDEPGGAGLVRHLQTQSRSYPLNAPRESIYRMRTEDPWEQGGSLSERTSRLQSYIHGETERYERPQSTADGLFHVLNATRHNQADLMPAYGLHHHFLGEENRQNIMDNLLGGMRGFQHFSAEPRPGILMMLNELDPSHQPSDPGVLSAGLSDPDLGERLNGMTPEQVMMLRAEGLPRSLFHLAVNTATHPTVYEGANTANLVQVLRRPFLSVMPDGGTPLLETGPETERGYQQIYDVSRSLGQRHYGLPFESTPRSVRDAYGQYDNRTASGIADRLGPYQSTFDVTNLLMSARNPSSEASAYYNEVFDRANSPRNRQVVSGLNQVLDLREQENPFSRRT